ncbi:MAG: DUF3747 domain-containing protein [Oculatellaceae cyanobacterium bins.114]|nr:DUF3747 domain-containing protein [Oculatellaceae cyanobacterium bins.114]
MKGGVGLRLSLLAAVGVGLSGFWAPATAAVRFEQRDVDQSRLIAIAAPVGNTSHQLLILEQLNNNRDCWEETGNSPTMVDPLLLDFDFTGICNRSTDSNGYSLRVGNQDLGLQYSLRVVRQNNDLVLMAISNRDRTTPPLEIGRTHGYTNGFARIELNPGWRMTKRVYNGQNLAHIYLTSDQDLPTLIASASGTRGDISIPVTRPPVVVTPPIATRPSPAPVPPITVSPSPPETLPTVTVPATPIARPTLPRPTPTPSTNRPLPTPSPSTSTSTVSYRVVVQADTLAQQDQVRAIAPGAFRTLVNGQAVMQAGLFRNRNTADILEQQLRAANLQAMVLPVAGWTPPTPPQPLPPTPNPSTPAPQTPIARRVVVIDPGHGGTDPGAIGIGGIQEKEIVLAIAQEVTSLLERHGVQAVMTRRDDRTLDLEPRVTFAERANADLFVSIHANSTPSGSTANGAETYYSSATGRQLAQAIQSNMIQSTGMIDRGVKQARFYVLTQTSMPAALVEVGFVTGQQDVRRLSSPTSRRQIAGAITDGILQYIQQGD